MTYLETFLECYYEHIENYEALLFILSLLPDSAQYVFAKTLLEHEDLLNDGDVYEGKKLEGIIKIKNNLILLENPSIENLVLLELPPVHEI